MNWRYLTVIALLLSCTSIQARTNSPDAIAKAIGRVIHLNDNMVTGLALTNPPVNVPVPNQGDSGSIFSQFSANTSGGLQHWESDISIPGRNGFDLNVGRKYDSLELGKMQWFMVAPTEIPGLSFSLADSDLGNSGVPASKLALGFPAIKTPWFGGYWDAGVGGALYAIKSNLNNAGETGDCLFTLAGTNFKFRKNNGAWYPAIKGEKGTLTETSSGYTFTDITGTTYQFTAAALNRVINLNYNVTTQQPYTTLVYTQHVNWEYDFYSDEYYSYTYYSYDPVTQYRTVHTSTTQAFTQTGYYLTQTTNRYGDILSYTYDTTTPISLARSDLRTNSSVSIGLTIAGAITPRRLHQVTDSFGRNITFTYRAAFSGATTLATLANEPLQASEIASAQYQGPSGTASVRYTYDTDDTLSGVAYPTGKTSAYQYLSVTSNSTNDGPQPGELLYQINTPSQLQLNLKYNWVQATDPRYSRYALIEQKVTGFSLPETLTWGYAYSSPENYQLDVDGSTPDSYGYQSLVTTTPFGNTLTNTFQQGLPTDQRTAYGWDATSTWDFTNRVKTSDVVQNQSFRQTTTYSQYDLLNNKPKQVSTTGSGRTLTTQTTFLHEVDAQIQAANILDVVKSNTLQFGRGTTLTQSFQFSAGNPFPTSLQTSAQSTDSQYGGLLAIPAQTTQWTYNAAHNIVGQTLPSGQHQTMTYQSDLYPASQTQDDLSIGTTTSWDLNTGLMLQNTPYNQAVSNTYYSDSRLRETISNPNTEDESHIKYSYDDTQNKVIQQFLGTGTTPYLTQETTYDALGRVVQIVKKDSNNTVYYQETHRYELNGVMVNHEVITMDNVTKTYDTTYDLLGRVVSTHTQEGNQMSYTYGISSDGYQTLTGMDGANRSWVRSYDAFSHLVKVRDGKGNFATYQVDEQGNLEQVTDLANQVTTYVFNGLGQLKQSASPFVIQQFTYDANGNLTSKRFGTSGTPQLQWLNFDSLGNPATIRTPSESIQLTYHTLNSHSLNRVSTLTRNGYACTYLYTPDGKLKEKRMTYPDTTQYQIDFTYTPWSALQSIQDPWGTTTYQFTPQLYVASVARDNSTLATYAYAAGFFGKKSAAALSNSLALSYSYDQNQASNWLTQVQLTGIPTPITYHNTGFDAEGNILSRQYQFSPNSVSVSFAYDANEQLTHAGYTNANNFDYTYDPAGNRTAYGSPLNQVTYTTDRGRQNSFALGWATATLTHDSMGNISGKTITQPSVGQVSRIGYIFSPLGELSTVSTWKTDPTIPRETLLDTIAYTYDEHHQKIAKSKNGSTVEKGVWGTRGEELAVVTSGNATVMIYDNDGKIQAEKHYPSNEIRYVMTNEVGSAVVVFSPTGQLLDQTLRDPFADIRYENGQIPTSVMGNGIHSSFRFPALWLKNKVVTKNTLFEASKELRIDSGITLQGGASAIFSGNSDVALKLETTISHTDPRSWYRLTPQATPSRSITLTYTGKRQDPDTNLFYFNARWVDPELGQFLSLDPSGMMPTDPETLNLYEYCGNNPVKLFDPDGKTPVLAAMAIGGVSGGIAGGIGAGLGAYTNGGTWSQVGMSALYGAGIGFVAGASFQPEGVLAAMGYGAIGGFFGGGGISGWNTYQAQKTTNNFDMYQLANDTLKGAVSGAFVGAVSAPWAAGELGAGTAGLFIAGEFNIAASLITSSISSQYNFSPSLFNFSSPLFNSSSSWNPSLGSYTQPFPSLDGSQDSGYPSYLWIDQ